MWSKANGIPLQNQLRIFILTLALSFTCGLSVSQAGLIHNIEFGGFDFGQVNSLSGSGQV